MTDEQLDELFARHAGGVTPSAEFANGLWTRIEPRLAESPEIDVFGVAADDPSVSIDMSEIQVRDDRRGQRGQILFLAASIVLVAGLVYAALSTDGDLDVSGPAAGSKAAEVVADYVNAFNRGDTEQVTALVAPGFTATEQTTRVVTTVTTFTKDEWEMRIAWRLGQAERILEPRCTSAVAGTETVIDCDLRTSTPVTRAAGEPPIDTAITFMVIADELVRIDERYLDDGGREVSRSFGRWVSAHYPDVDEATREEWTSIEQATEYGRIRAAHTDLWAGFLEESGCAFDDRTCGWATLTFDGTSCTYDGPQEVTLRSLFGVEYTNPSGVVADARLWQLNDHDATLESIEFFQGAPPGEIRAGFGFGSQGAQPGPQELSMFAEELGSLLISCHSSGSDVAVAIVTIVEE